MLQVHRISTRGPTLDSGYSTPLCHIGQQGKHTRKPDSHTRMASPRQRPTAAQPLLPPLPPGGRPLIGPTPLPKGTLLSAPVFHPVSHLVWYQALYLPIPAMRHHFAPHPNHSSLNVPHTLLVIARLFEKYHDPPCTGLSKDMQRPAHHEMAKFVTSPSRVNPPSTNVNRSALYLRRTTVCYTQWEYASSPGSWCTLPANHEQILIPGPAFLHTHHHLHRLLLHNLSSSISLTGLTPWPWLTQPEPAQC
jgi:hypothetical protein